MTKLSKTFIYDAASNLATDAVMERRRKWEEEREAVFLACYNAHYSPSDRKLLADIPDGWLPKVNAFQVEFLDEKGRKRSERICTHKDGLPAKRCDMDYGSITMLTTNKALAKRVTELRKENYAIDEEHRSIGRDVQQTLEALGTVKQLRDQWPEGYAKLEKYLPAPVSKGLPTALPELNKRLGLK